MTYNKEAKRKYYLEHRKSKKPQQSKSTVMICKYCGKEKRVYKRDKDQGWCQEYCSRNCKRAAGVFKEKITFTCLVCGKIKIVYNNEHNSNKYCSKECYLKVKSRDTITIICKNCGKEKKVSKQEQERGHYKEYCSQACRSVVVGKINNQRRGGSWKKKQLLALARDNNICRLCNSSPATDVHHIVPFRDFKSGKKANKVKNLISLCKDCHKLTYAHEHEFVEIFKRILEKESN